LQAVCIYRNDAALCRPASVIPTKGRLNRQERFEQPTKFAGSKFERPKVGLKGELQDVIRNAGPKGEGQEPVVNPPYETCQDSGFLATPEIMIIGQSYLNTIVGKNDIAVPA
jgi:hypothetical protein